MTGSGDLSGEARHSADQPRITPDDAALRTVERLMPAARGRTHGTQQGKRRSGTFGASLEFADYRPYTPGDDIRRLDWNVYGRTGRAYIRQYWDEQELNITFYLDVSASMRWTPSGGSGNKLAHGAQLAALAGYAALCADDRVAAVTFAGREAGRLHPVRGRGAAVRLFDFLEQAMAPTADPGADDMRQPLLGPGMLPPRSGQCWLLTDGLYAEGIEETLLALAAARQDVVFVHVLSAAELRPELAGELRLIDAESGGHKDVAVHPRVIAAYGEALEAHCSRIRKICAELGFAYLLADTSISPLDTVSGVMMRQGLLRR